MMRITLSILLLLTASPTLARAEDLSGSRILLEQQLRQSPGDAAAMVNLARIYVQAGRTSKAHRLYRELLGMENVALDRAAGPPVWSHWLAAEAIKNTGKAAKVKLSSRP